MNDPQAEELAYLDANQECRHGSLPADLWVDCDCFEGVVTDREWHRAKVESIEAELKARGEQGDRIEALVDRLVKELVSTRRRNELRAARRSGKGKAA